MTKARKKTVSAKAPEIRLTVRLTPEGIEEAQQRLSDLQQRLRVQARDELLALAQEISAGSPYGSDEEALADIQAAVDEVRAERAQRRLKTA